MSYTLISVIIPIYNAECFIAETLDSVIIQTHKNLEVLCINDGSTDNSLGILRDYAGKDTRIKIVNIKNEGQSAASNLGIKQAKGDYIKFLDADDRLSPNHLALQLKVLEEQSDHIASCEWGRFYNDDYLSAKFNPEPVWKNMDSIEWIKTALSQKSDMMGAWIWLIPKQILDKAGHWNEKLSLNNDFDFSIRLLLASRGVKFAYGAKLYYRSGISESLSQVLTKKAVESAFLTTKLGCNNILEYENTNLTRRLCADRYQIWIFRVYPKYPDLIKNFEKEIKSLGGSKLKMEGGKLFILLRNIWGWKTTKYIQLFFYKFGWKLIIKIKKK